MMHACILDSYFKVFYSSRYQKFETRFLTSDVLIDVDIDRDPCYNIVAKYLHKLHVSCFGILAGSQEYQHIH